MTFSSRRPLTKLESVCDFKYCWSVLHASLIHSIAFSHAFTHCPFLFVRSLLEGHVGARLAQGRLEAVRKGPGDGLAIAGGVVGHRVRILVNNCLNTRLSPL